MRKRQIDEDLKSLNATEDALNSIKSANVTSQEVRAVIPAMKPRKIEDLEDDAVNATENANTTKSSQTIPADAMKPMKREIDLEEVDLLNVSILISTLSTSHFPTRMFTFTENSTFKV